MRHLKTYSGKDSDPVSLMNSIYFQPESKGPNQRQSIMRFRATQIKRGLHENRNSLAPILFGIYGHDSPPAVILSRPGCPALRVACPILSVIKI